MTDFIRPQVRALTGYTPGEQPRDDGFIKLNTNENPYPPSPRVFEAIRAALTGDKLRKYPDPLGTAFRETAGRILNVPPEAILIGNGSDDALTILTRTLVPEGGLVVFPTPSYLLYRTLAEIQGARWRTIPFDAAWQLHADEVPREAAVTFVANPNSPSGTLVHREILADWPGPLVVDEAYADFADENCLGLLSRRSDVVITRSLSKSYSLAGIRLGFAVADPDLVRHLVKVKDSYNCDVLSLAAAVAALEDQSHMRANVARIRATRQRLTEALRRLGFEVTESQANFVWARHALPVKPLYEELKRRRILIRYMEYPGYGDGLRISVGTDAEIDCLLDHLQSMI
ncbi:MAG: histidinol-phosphate transaminase [Gemmatales bacterium]|nr:histidinol-phosphate transaminase [Gemmatales bacterium]MDW8387292.1 histidinol-phosphate transaminase [Gemmatales bacterium]